MSDIRKIIYQSLTDCLENATSKSVIISVEKAKENTIDETYRNYMAFNSYIELNSYIQSTLPQKRHFHEIIKGNKPCKLYYDIDIPAGSENTILIVCKLIMDKTIEVLGKLGRDPNIGYKDFYLLMNTNTSTELSKKTCKFKQSMHIIFNKYNFPSMTTVKYIAESVFKVFPEEHIAAIDKGVYKNNQSFRLPYCCKMYKSDAIMKPITNYSINGRSVKISRYTDQTTLFTNGCIGAEHGKRKIIKLPKSEHKINAMNISNDLYMKGIGIIEEILGDTFTDFNLFQKDNYFTLRRISPSACVVCEDHRIHDAIDQFAFITKKLTGQVLVYGCYQTNKKIEKPISVYRNI